VRCVPRWPERGSRCDKARVPAKDDTDPSQMKCRIRSRKDGDHMTNTYRSLRITIEPKTRHASHANARTDLPGRVQIDI